MYFIFNRYFTLKPLFALLVEFFLIFGTAVLAAAVRFNFHGTAVAVYDPALLKTTILTMTYLAVFYYCDLYGPELYRPGRQMVMKLIEAILISTIMLFSLYYIFPSIKTWRGILLANTIVLPFLIVGWRTLFTGKLPIEMPKKNVLIIGAGELAKKIGQEIYRQSEDGLRLVGFIDDDPAKLGQSIVNPGVVGGYGDIARIVRFEKIDRIIVALPDRRAKLPMRALLDCKLSGVTIEEGETFQERMTGRIPLDHLKPSWMVFSDGFRSLRTRKILKRILDVILSLSMLLVSLPVMAITAVLIKAESRGPAVFRQTRVGENGKVFDIYKFRSMTADAETNTGPVWATTNDSRVTRVGKVIRKLRIDELPQLINVLKGDMSFVGPRPERPFFVEKLKKVIPYYEMRTVVKPGLTGWAQIKYPYGASAEDALEKLQYDIYYIKNMSPLLDAVILFLTIKVVLTGRGAR